jgi:transposase-like protein
MGRKSKLSEKQWLEVERRLLEGETVRALAKEFGISEAAIRQRGIPSRAQKTKDVANQIVATERALQELPISSQINAQNLAAKLRSISDSIAAAAELGARTAHRLHALANSEVAKVDDAEPMASLDNLKNVGVLTKLGNDSANIALNLLAANKDKVKPTEDDPDKPAGVLVVPGLATDAGAWSQAVQGKRE